MKKELDLQVINGNCLDVLKTFADNHFDSVVTDPPYGWKFMGKNWDYDVPAVETLQEILRVLKPGGHMLVACGTRTQHRMIVNVEDAGFEIRDIITHHYSTGFPKSLNISKALDKQAGVEREVIATSGTMPIQTSGKINSEASASEKFERKENTITAPASDAAKKWDGWGTALKPATEFWTLCRKPLEENTIADNVLKYGTGGLNIDACRIPFKNDADFNSATFGRGTDILGGNYIGGTHGSGKTNIEANTKGRFPANVIFDVFTAKLLDEQSGTLKSGAMKKSYVYQNNGFSMGAPTGSTNHFCEASEGGASRFFYCAKPSKGERNYGLEDFEKKENAHASYGIHTDEGLLNNNRNPENRSRLVQNFHPTVKPLKLCRFLVKLITPPDGIVLDPFCGSGTTGIACKAEQFNFVGIDITPEYCELSRARISAWDPDPEDADDMQLLLEFPE